MIRRMCLRRAERAEDQEADVVGFERETELAWAGPVWRGFTLPNNISRAKMCRQNLKIKRQLDCGHYNPGLAAA
ncbi:hypothetical protein EVAR_39239_1 [Eumeta japonica]|uniref:Uncharacterized protein n=1 Tax=Eumeta variegata TaxID=151549 RepID=A0A4C1XZI7_EUMVA|nr:hypothetical protein EVAR_39239_1 [Eumeta japonica]